MRQAQGRSMQLSKIGTKGASLTDYGLIVGAVSITAVVAASQLGGKVTTAFNDIGVAISDAEISEAAPPVMLADAETDPAPKEAVLACSSEAGSGTYSAAVIGTEGDDAFTETGENDIFLAHGCYGNDTLTLTTHNYQERDVLYFQREYRLADVTTSYIGDDMVISYIGASGSFTIVNDGSDSSSASRNHINVFSFSDIGDISRQDFMVSTLGTPGDDVFNSSGENDIFPARPNEGHDRLLKNSSNYQESDTIAFAEGITPADLLMEYVDQDAVILFINANGSFTIPEDASDSSSADKRHPNVFKFSDGTKMTRQQFMAATLGSLGDDTFNSSGVSDTFPVRANEGHDSLLKTSRNYQEYDTLLFDEGIELADLTTTYVGDDARITFAGQTGSFTVLMDGWDSSSADQRHPTKFKFADGTQLTRQEFMTATLGTPGDDTFNSSGVSDSFPARPNEGDDRIIRASSNYQETDTLHFAAGLVPDDLETTYDGTDMVIRYASAAGSMRIVDDGSDSSSATAKQIGRFSFSNGTQLSRKDFMFETLGTSGDDLFNGSGVSDVFPAGPGRGDDTIMSTTSNYQEVDTVRFVEGVVPEDISGTYVGSDLVLSFSQGGSLTILRESDGARYQMNTYSFPDGTTYSRADFVALVTGP